MNIDVTISIHALLAESDVLALCSFGGAFDFYPRSPCGERPIILAHWGGTKRFLSTLSLRRATSWVITSVLMLHHFYPRSPCGERLYDMLIERANDHISIHALLAESDLIGFYALSPNQLFLSTLSLRRATAAVCVPHFSLAISIHALLAESDAGRRCLCYRLHISIHALLAESDSSWLSSGRRFSTFLSTLSLRRATYDGKTVDTKISISIHALLAESDRPPRQCCPPRCYFYPRSPCRERHLGLYLFERAAIISIHALLAESDWKMAARWCGCMNFYPRSPCGERLMRKFWPQSAHYFYPRSPCGERQPGMVISIGTGDISIHALLAESDDRAGCD